MSMDRRTLLKASALGVGGLAVSTAMPGELLPAAHAGPPPTPAFGRDIDGYASYEGQTQCIGSEQAGVAAFKKLVLASYPGSRNLGIIRACNIGGTSEHKEGRAWDWGVYATRPNEAAMAQQLLAWLLGTDQYGNRQAIARRLGIMYIIWNRRIWKAYSKPNTWHTYTGSNPHTDHIHFSFGWPGARKQTSFWTGSTGSSQHVYKWSPWTSTAGELTGAPTATSWDSKRTDVFAVGAGGTLKQRWMVAGHGWGPGTGWHDLGAPPGRRLTASPTVVSRYPGMLGVLARGSDGQVWQRQYNPGSSWGAWHSLGGVCTSAPAAASMDSGHLMVVVRGTDMALHSRTWRRGAGWSGWSQLTGAVTSGPALVSHSPGHLDLFARGSAGDLVHKSYSNGRWSGWMSRGGGLADAAIAAATMYPGRFDVFVVGTNARIYRQTYLDGRWYAPNKTWENFGGPPDGAVAGVGVTSLNSRHLEVFSRGADNRLYQRWYS